MIRALVALLSLLMVMSCGEVVTESTKDARILMMGDSMMAANRTAGRSVGAMLERKMGEPVIDRSVYAARIIYNLPLTGAAGLSIPAQYQQGNWDWVVLNGGGNDLIFGCACGRCDGMVDRLISEDATTGRIPDLVQRLRKSGARVVWSGYLRNPGLFTPVRPCRVFGDELDRRLARLDARDPGMIFVPMSDLVPEGDPSLHQQDLVHPSPKGSAAIGARIAAAIRAAER
jgi:lysophospholipase L1-like esterase